MDIASIVGVEGPCQGGRSGAGESLLQWLKIARVAETSAIAALNKSFKKIREGSRVLQFRYHEGTNLQRYFMSSEEMV